MFNTIKKTILPTIAILLLFFLFWKKNNSVTNSNKEILKKETTNSHTQRDQTVIPPKALHVLQYIQQHGKAPDGYVGGKKFYNREKKLPQLNNKSEPASYTEWDINPKEKNTNRGTQRIVISNDGSAWYTADHYNTFIKINAP